MKKALFPIFLTLASLSLLVSCQSHEPLFEDGGSNPADLVVNEWIDSTFNENYLWDTPNNPDFSLSPEKFFSSIKNSSDNVSDIWKTQSGMDNLTYSIGFEYGINEYNDNSVYYVILYTNRDSDASQKGLERGFLITHVNNVSVNRTNAKSLLKNAFDDGSDVDLTYLIPGVNMNAKTITVKPSLTAVENPVYLSEVIGLSNNSKIGYIVYNNFTPGSNYIYDAKLASEFTRFKNEGVDYLVIDLRYNAGGTISSAAVLGSAAVANRVVGDEFITYKRSRETGNPIPADTLIDKTRDPGSTPIPVLGNQLKRVYVITGAYTAAVSEAFVNALKAYPDDVNLTIVGEPSQGNSVIVTGRTSKDGWSMNLAIAYMANKKGEYNYMNGIVPDIEASDVSKDKVTRLRPLGDTRETMLAAVINHIVGGTRSSFQYSEGSRSLGSSIQNKPSANQSIIDLDRK